MNSRDWLISLSSLLIRLLIRLPRPMATWLIRLYLRIYPVRLHEAADPNVRSYANFNEFFTRPLAPGQRPLIRTTGGIYSPVDGAVSQFGSLCDGRLIQAKGVEFSARRLCTEAIDPIVSGSFITLYLAPADYHRVHIPLDARLRRAVRTGGQTFSVAADCVKKIPDLYCRNRRMIAEFDSSFGRVVLVMVGARNVSAISTAWQWPQPDDIYIPRSPPRYRAQDEIGRFNLGSTVIVLFEFPLRWQEGLNESVAVRLGQTIAHAATPKATQNFARASK